MKEKFGFRAYKEGNKKIKDFLPTDYTIEIRKFLQSKGMEMPKILNIIDKKDKITIESEWIEGKNFLDINEDIINRRSAFQKELESIKDVKDSYIQSELNDFDCKEEMIVANNYWHWGIYMGKMHNIKNEQGLNIASHDLQLGNVIKTNDGRIMLCDFTKLYYTDFPEEEIVRYILNPYPLLLKYKEAFMDGYLKTRNITLDFIIKRLIDINWDNYHDLYCNGKLLRSGPRSSKRLKFIPKDLTGLTVLDLGCSCGMLAREAKRRGAKYVLAIEKQGHNGHHLIDLVAAVSFAEGLDVHCLYSDIENIGCFQRSHFDIIFFCAVLGHLKGDRFKYLQMLREKCKILYFETNLGGKELAHRKLLEEAGFKDIECLGESGDPDRENNSHYLMFKCKGDLE